MKTKNIPVITRRTTFITLALSMLLTPAVLRADENDDRIDAAAKSTYVFKTFLVEDSVTTKTKDGITTLSGSVKEADHKQLAQDTVAGLPGVKSVDNQIEIKETPEKYSDTWLYLKVKNTLAFHRSVSALKTTVVLKEAVVTLTGEASSEAQKELTAEYASDVEGVKAVRNEMTVSTQGEPEPLSLSVMIDDASISAQVRAALFTHRSTSAFQTSVLTSNGIVTVGGIAKNEAEKNLVTKLVSDIHGVKSVVNNMIIKPITAAN